MSSLAAAVQIPYPYTVDISGIRNPQWRCITLSDLSDIEILLATVSTSIFLGNLGCPSALYNGDELCVSPEVYSYLQKKGLA